MNAQKNNRLGETKTMNCGLKCTIIEYNNINNITIKFEDGTIVKNKGYNNFQKSAIGYPSFKSNKIINNYTILNKINMSYYMVLIPDNQKIVMSVPEIQQLKKHGKTT